MTTDEAVAKGMEIFAVLEDLAQKAKEAEAGLDAVFDAIQTNGVISQFEAKALKLRGRAIALNNQAAYHDYHAHCTWRAQLKGIDVPQPLDGGGSR